MVDFVMFGVAMHDIFVNLWTRVVFAPVHALLLSEQVCSDEMVCYSNSDDHVRLSFLVHLQ